MGGAGQVRLRRPRRQLGRQHRSSFSTAYIVVDLVVLCVIISFQDLNGWKLGKFVRDLSQAQKGNNYQEKWRKSNFVKRVDQILVFFFDDISFDF